MPKLNHDSIVFFGITEVEFFLRRNLGHVFFIDFPTRSYVERIKIL